jgi:hypothetical protein
MTDRKLGKDSGRGKFMWLHADNRSWIQPSVDLWGNTVYQWKKGEATVKNWARPVKDIRNIGIVNWRQAAEDRDGWRKETREKIIILRR